MLTTYSHSTKLCRERHTLKNMQEIRLTNQNPKNKSTNTPHSCQCGQISIAKVCARIYRPPHATSPNLTTAEMYIFVVNSGVASKSKPQTRVHLTKTKFKVNLPYLLASALYGHHAYLWLFYVKKYTETLLQVRRADIVSFLQHCTVRQFDTNMNSKGSVPTLSCSDTRSASPDWPFAKLDRVGCESPVHWVSEEQRVDCCEATSRSRVSAAFCAERLSLSFLRLVLPFRCTVFLWCFNDAFLIAEYGHDGKSHGYLTPSWTERMWWFKSLPLPVA